MTTSTKSPPTQPFAVRLTDGQRNDIMAAAGEIDLSFPDTLRLAIKFGLPVLKRKLRSARTRASLTDAGTQQSPAASSG